MKSTDIRAAFLNYFNAQGHAVVASSSLVPGNDPTLLFTNAGMVQFKDVFLGRDQRSYSRAASSQRCVRAGGKHNDLENVGYTARHHTFFEMLGNFSFGDYFKQDAISFAWEFLTGVLKLPKDKLWVTVFRDDDEAADIWIKQIGVDPSRVTRMGEKSNFWQMGDTGPCGPCTEIFFDHGPEVWGGPPGTPEEDGDRYIEIWNLVFMQFDRQPSGELVPLPKPSVDTGMGLERISAVMQHVHSNYEIDLFKNLLTAAAEVVGVSDITLGSLRVIGDHIRSCAFLITDGVLPSNEGRGYVLRRIIRRAIRHGNKLGKKEPFFHRLVQPLVVEMGEAYPELAKAAKHVEKVLLAEEEQFAKTLENGLRILENDLANLNGKVISGSTVFTLYDTYGFPADLTGDIARERGLSIDEAGFELEMENQRRKSKEHSKFGNDYHNALNVEESSEFCGYDEVEGEAKVLAIYVNGEKTDSIQTGQSGVVVLDRTPFYAESGGQIGDTGELDGKTGSFKVEDTVKEKDAFLHRGTVAHGHIKVGETLKAQIDAYRRAAIRLNHSATHLMHAALRKILGDHVGQKGSQVTADRLRFDFSHFEAMTPDQIEAVENLVNAQIRANTPVQTNIMDIDSARKKGAMALFGEKYGETVRVLSMGEQDFSVELCGGTHANRTGDIGVFKIVSEGGVASGVRRIEGVTGLGALNYLKQTDELLSEISVLLKGSRDTVVPKVKQAVERQKELEKEIERLKQKLATSSGLDLESQVQTIQGLKLLVAEMEGLDGKSLRAALDQWKDKLKSAVVVLASVEGEKVNVIAGVTADYTAKIKAGELVNFIASQVGGKGGGRADMAQAGGNDPGKLAAALASVTGWITERLS